MQSRPSHFFSLVFSQILNLSSDSHHRHRRRAEITCLAAHASIRKNNTLCYSFPLSESINSACFMSCRRWCYRSGVKLVPNYSRCSYSLCIGRHSLFGHDNRLLKIGGHFCWMMRGYADWTNYAGQVWICKFMGGRIGFATFWFSTFHYSDKGRFASPTTFPHFMLGCLNIR